MKAKVDKKLVEPGIWKFDLNGKARYEVRVSRRVDGKRYFKHITVPNISQARIQKRELLIELDREIRRPKTISFGEFLEIYLKEMESEWAEKTVYNRRFCLENKFNSEFSAVPLGDITPAQITAHFGKVTEARKYGTKREHLKSIKGLFQAAVNKGIIPSNPTIGIKFRKSKEDEFEPIGLTQEEVEKLLEVTRKDHLLLFYHAALAVYTAARAGELRALTWRDVDLKGRSISISKSEDPRLEKIKRTKSGEGRRVPINDELMEILQELQRNGSAAASDPVLPYWRDFARNEQGRYIKMYCASLGLPKIRFHDLRATAIMLMLNGNVPMTRVMQISGHKSLKAFQKYLRLSTVNTKGGTDCLKFTKRKKKNDADK